MQIKDVKPGTVFRLVDGDINKLYFKVSFDWILSEKLHIFKVNGHRMSYEIEKVF